MLNGVLFCDFSSGWLTKNTGNPSTQQLRRTRVPADGEARLQRGHINYTVANFDTPKVEHWSQDGSVNSLIDRPSAAPASDVSQDASADRASRADTGRSVIYYLVTSCCSAAFPMTYLWEPHPSSIMDLQKVKKGHGCGSGCKGPVHLMSYSALVYFSHPAVLGFRAICSNFNQFLININ